MTKLCHGCKQVKPLAEFSVDRGIKIGRCSRCKLCRKAYNRHRYQTNTTARMKIRDLQRLYRSQHRDRVKKCAADWVKANPDRIQEYHQRTHAKLKESVINIYSDGEAVCSRCGQGDIDVLCLDHINNDGAMDRRHRVVVGTRLYKQLRDHDYPNGFQVLCYNCNFKKHLEVNRARRAMTPTTKGR